MKPWMKYPFYVALALGTPSCKKTLDVSPTQEGNTPQFNFLARLSEDSGGRLDTVTAQLYLKQLDGEAPGEEYRLVVTFPATLDGSLLYSGKSYRSGDWIPVAYAGLEAFTTPLMIIPYRPTKGTHTLNLALSDRRQQNKTASLPLVIP